MTVESQEYPTENAEENSETCVKTIGENPPDRFSCVIESLKISQSSAFLFNISHSSGENKGKSSDKKSNSAVIYSVTCSGDPTIEYDEYGFERPFGWSNRNHKEKIRYGNYGEIEELNILKHWKIFLASLGKKYLDEITFEDIHGNSFLEADFRKLIQMYGIPHKYRREIWQLCCDLKGFKKKFQFNYAQISKICMVSFQEISSHESVLTLKQHLKDLFPQHHPESHLNSHNMEQWLKECREIENDLLRTMPNNFFFQSSKSNGVPKLRRVLRSICLSLPQIGYCQGMGLLAATFLLAMEEEESFWMMMILLGKIMPKNYYSSTLLGARADQKILLDCFLRRILPDVHEKITSLRIELPLITLNWFITIYCGVVTMDHQLRIWDVLFSQGSDVLFGICLAYFTIHRDLILSYDDAGDLFNCLSSLPSRPLNMDFVLRTCFDILENQISFGEIPQQRAEALNHLEQEAKLVKKKKAKKMRSHQSGLPSSGASSAGILSSLRRKQSLSRGTISLEWKFGVLPWLSTTLNSFKSKSGRVNHPYMGQNVSFNAAHTVGEDFERNSIISHSFTEENAECTGGGCEKRKHKNIRKTEKLLALRRSILAIVKYFQNGSQDKESFLEDSQIEAGFLETAIQIFTGASLKDPFDASHSRLISNPQTNATETLIPPFDPPLPLDESPQNTLPTASTTIVSRESGTLVYSVEGSIEAGAETAGCKRGASGREEEDEMPALVSVFEEGEEQEEIGDRETRFRPVRESPQKEMHEPCRERVIAPSGRGCEGVGGRVGDRHLVRGKAVWNYYRREDDELQFRKNDIINIYSMDDEDCWYGEMNGRFGYFPSQFVHLLDERRKEYNSLGDDTVSMKIHNLVRQDLCDALVSIFQHGYLKGGQTGAGGRKISLEIENSYKKCRTAKSSVAWKFPLLHKLAAVVKTVGNVGSSFWAPSSSAIPSKDPRDSDSESERVEEAWGGGRCGGRAVHFWEFIEQVCKYEVHGCLGERDEPTCGHRSKAYSHLLLYTTFIDESTEGRRRGGDCFSHLRTERGGSGKGASEEDPEAMFKLTASESLYLAVRDINITHNQWFERQKGHLLGGEQTGDAGELQRRIVVLSRKVSDMKFRSLVCAGLNQQRFHEWFEVISKPRPFLDGWYHPLKSFINSPVRIQIAFDLELLSKFSMNLTVDWELYIRPSFTAMLMGSATLESDAVSLGSLSTCLGDYAGKRSGGELKTASVLKENIRKMLIKHHLFSWEL